MVTVVTVTQTQLLRAFSENFYGSIQNEVPVGAFHGGLYWKPRNTGGLPSQVFDLASALLDILKQDHVVARDASLLSIRLALENVTFPSFAHNVDFSGISVLKNVDFSQSSIDYCQAPLKNCAVLNCHGFSLFQPVLGSEARRTAKKVVHSLGVRDLSFFWGRGVDDLRRHALDPRKTIGKSADHRGIALTSHSA